jgi:hypothetical protein
MVIVLGQTGRNPTGINATLSSVNAWLHWLYEERLLPERLKVSMLKVEHQS